MASATARNMATELPRSGFPRVQYGPMIWGDRVTESYTTNAGPGRTRIPRQRRSTAADRARLRRLAEAGLLGALSQEERRRLLPAAYELAYPIVYDVITRRIARNRGHNACSHGLRHMEDSCLDGFHDDLEAVAEHLLAVTQPITDLEGWLARRAQNAAIDGHRRRRGEQGALQRPRMTKALAEGLGDPWLCELALKILTWVGLPGGVGVTVWPLDSWARDRADHTGDHRGSTPARVQADIDRVLAVMRRRPDWYERNVERPLGRKTTPVAGSPGERAGEPRPLLVLDAAEAGEARFADLAAVAVEAIRAGLNREEDPTVTVVTVLTTLFLDGSGADEIDRAPGGGTSASAEDRLSAVLGDPAAVTALVQRVLRIVRGPG